MTARRLGVWPDRSPEWYAARVGRIGGSDIGVLMGWAESNDPTRWSKSRAQLFAEKSAELAGEKIERTGSPAKSRGIYCEPAIAAWLADREGVTYDPEYVGTWVKDDADWMMCNPDKVTTDRRLVEFKTTEVRDEGHGWGRAGTDLVPLTYAAQCQWSLGILGFTSCLLAVLSGAPRFEFALYKIKFNPAAFAYLTQEATKFRHQLLTPTNQKAA